MKSAVQKIPLSSPVVAETERGGLALAAGYWAEIRRRTAGLVRVRHAKAGPQLRLVGSVTLFRFGAPSVRALEGTVECRLAIVGGLLAKEEGGWLTFTQRTSPSSELEVAIEDYVPFLHSVRPRRSARRFAYRQIQERAHRAISHHYLMRMAALSR